MGFSYIRKDLVEILSEATSSISIDEILASA